MMKSLTVIFAMLVALLFFASTTNAQGVDFQDDDELLIPLMKKGHIPRGPPRFGKRSGGGGGIPNHMRLRQFSLYGPMMQILPRNNELHEYNPYGF